jgi:hypothetical protein
MSTLPSPVQSGQIITAKFFNDLIDKMKELEDRLNAMQPGGVPTAVIERFDPVSQQEVGKQLTIFGKFDFPPSRNTVQVDGVAITDFRAGSNDSQLILVIPTSITVPAGGSKDVRIFVSNSSGQDDKAYRLLPATPSSIPNPTIVNVVNFQTPANPPETGKKVLITGANFAATPQNNVVTFSIQTASGNKIFPAGALDTGNTNASQIVVTAPDIPDIGLLSTAPVTVTVDVGSPLPATFQVNMIHLP